MQDALKQKKKKKSTATTTRMMERSVCACVHFFFLSRLYERHIITAAYTQLHNTISTMTAGE